MSQANIDFDRCLERLLSNNRQLDRYLDAMLERAGLPADIFARLPSLIARLPKDAVAHASRQIPTETDRPKTDAAALERLSRPSERELRRTFRGRLLRA